MDKISEELIKNYTHESQRQWKIISGERERLAKEAERISRLNNWFIAAITLNVCLSFYLVWTIFIK